MTPPRTVRFALAAMVVLTAFVGAAAGQQAVAGEGGHRFDVGGASPHITFWLHFDLLTNLGGPGDLGFSAVGTALDVRVVVLDVQLHFDGVGPLGDFLSDPLSRFAVTAHLDLNLPFLSAGPAADDDFSFEDNQSINGSSV